MLYIQHGLNNAVMEPIEAKFCEFIRTYEPQTVKITKENKQQLKNNADYAFSGRLKNNKRTKENVEYRDLIAIDLDHIGPELKNPQALFDRIKSNLGLCFAMYPTISNGLEGMRYRIVFSVPPLTPENYQTLVKGLSYMLLRNGTISEIDKSNWKTSQIFGLPIRNQFSPEELIMYNLDGEILTRENAEKLLAENGGIRSLISRYEPPKKGNGKTVIQGNNTHTISYGAKLLNLIAGGVSAGYRNNIMNKFLWYWYQQGMEPGKLYQLSCVVRKNFFEDDGSFTDLDNARILQSIIRKEE